MSGTVIVLGAGAQRGIGGALSLKFAREGHHVIVTGRTLAKVEKIAASIRDEGLSAEAMQVDVTSESDQDALFEHAKSLGQLAAVLYNAGNNAIIPFADLTAETMEQFWRVGQLGAFHSAKRALPLFEAQGNGSLFFTGASASMRGRPNFAHFAAMKAGLRMMAQALAREYGPKGVHVAHFVIDGIVDAEMTRTRFGDYMDSLGQDGILDPHEIAETYWHIHQQQRSAWTHELELRPFSETW